MTDNSSDNPYKSPQASDVAANDSDIQDNSGTTSAHPQHIVSRNLMLMLWDMACFSIMVGLGEQIISLFTMAMPYENAETVAGLITTIPMLAGAALQLITPMGVRWLGTHRRWTLASAGLQSLCFVPFAIAAMVGYMPIWLLYLVASVYWGASMAAGAAWNVWVTGIVPIEVRSSFFAHRTRLGQICQLVSFVVAGFALNWGTSHKHELGIYATLFCIAGVSRFLSTMFLYYKTEPVNGHEHTATWHWGDLKDIWRRGQAGPLLAFLWMMYAACFISGPYFAPYYKKDLNYDYIQFMVAHGSMIFAKIMILPWAGFFAHRYGARRLMIITGLSLIPLPLFWTLNREMYWVISLQLLGGICWGAFELSIVLMFIEATPVQKRTSILTIYNLGHACAISLGSLIGGYLLYKHGKDTEAYYFLFRLSVIGRCCSLIWLFFLPRSQYRASQESNNS